MFWSQLKISKEIVVFWNILLFATVTHCILIIKWWILTNGLFYVTQPLQGCLVPLLWELVLSMLYLLVYFFSLLPLAFSSLTHLLFASTFKKVFLWHGSLTILFSFFNCQKSWQNNLVLLFSSSFHVHLNFLQSGFILTFYTGSP